MLPLIFCLVTNISLQERERERESIRRLMKWLAPLNATASLHIVLQQISISYLELYSHLCFHCFLSRYQFTRERESIRMLMKSLAPLNATASLHIVQQMYQIFIFFAACSRYSYIYIM